MKIPCDDVSEYIIVFLIKLLVLVLLIITLCGTMSLIAYNTYRIVVLLGSY